MPAGDKTGPTGAGPATGRGRGGCETGPISITYESGFPGWGRAGYGAGLGYGPGWGRWGFGIERFAITQDVPKETAIAALQREKERLETTLEHVDEQLETLMEEGQTDIKPSEKG